MCHDWNGGTIAQFFLRAFWTRGVRPPAPNDGSPLDDWNYGELWGIMGNYGEPWWYYGEFWWKYGEFW